MEAGEETSAAARRESRAWPSGEREKARVAKEKMRREMVAVVSGGFFIWVGWELENLGVERKKRVVGNSEQSSPDHEGAREERKKMDGGEF